MTLEETLKSVWEQVLTEQKARVELSGQVYRVETTGAKRLRMVEFAHDGHRILGIEQNPATSSQWAALARGGKQVMQFRSRGAYIGNVCEGRLTRYAAWSSLGLPP
jgi:hypothetical protein